MDFNDFMACCSANYQRMYKLLNCQYRVGDTLHFTLGTTGQCQLNIIQKQAYTDTIGIQYDTINASKWLSNFVIEVKMYHDANLVEVSACKDPQGKMQSFTHVSSHKYFPYWEKWQINKLLSEMLACIAFSKNNN